MRILVLALALLPTAAIAQQATPAAKPAVAGKPCRTQPQMAAKPAEKPVRPHSLAEEPHASAYRPVVRLVDGCEVPVKVSDGVGDVQR